MPRGSKPLEDVPPAKRDRSVPDEIWNIPRLVAQRGRQLDLDQRELARRSGLTQGTISRLLSYHTLKRFPLATAFALEDALESPGLLVARERQGAIIDERRFNRDAKKLSKPPSADFPERAGK